MGEGAWVAAGMALLLTAWAVAMPAGVAPSPQAEAHVAKRAPQAQAPDASGSDDDAVAVGVQVNPSSGSSRTVQITVQVDDDNGHNDVSSLSVTVYKSDNSTVHIAAGTASKSAGQGKRSTYVYNFNMQYFDDAGTYYVTATATDGEGDSSSAYGSFVYNSLAAVSLSSSSILLNPGGSSSASVAPNSDTHSNPSSVSVSNAGNTRIDLQYSGTDLTNATYGSSIGVDNVHLAYAANMTGELTLSTSTQTDTIFDLVKGSGSSKTVYFAIHVPTGVRAATYAGIITLAAVQG